MKQLSYLTGFLFASLAAIPASGQTTTNSFPKLWEKPTKTIMMAPPRRTPQAIDDKAKGITMYAGQLVSQNKKRGWIKFRTGKALRRKMTNTKLMVHIVLPLMEKIAIQSSVNLTLME